MTDALNRNAAAAPQPDRRDPAPSARRLTLRQEMLVKEFSETYDIAPTQIGFDGDSDVPFFHFEALSRLVITLSNFAELAVREGSMEASRTASSAKFDSESLPGGETIDDLQTALDVARARGLRSALRMVGFDPVRAHEAAKRGDLPPHLNPMPQDEARQRDLAQIHIIATEAGVLSPGDASRYRSLINTFFPGCESAAELDAAQRSQFIAILKGLKTARESVLANDPTSKGWVEKTLRGAHGSP